MISLIFILLASFLNACMDNLSHHFYKSIFNQKSLNPLFWNPEISWMKKSLTWTNYKLDAWHLCKSLMIICMIFSVILYNPIINPVFDFMIYGLIWNLYFNLFYNHILNKKTYGKR